MLQRYRRVFKKFESRPGAEFEVALLNRIFESAGGAHDWHGSVLEAVDLVQPAGFVVRRHQEDVGAGLDFVSEGAIIAKMNEKLSGEAIGQPTKEVAVFCLSSAEDDHDHVLFRQLVAESGNQVKAFLRSHARDDGDDRRLRGNVLRMEKPQQIFAAFGFTREITSRIRGNNVTIALRTPPPIIHAVENAAQMHSAAADDGIHAKSIGRRLNFFGIGAADSRDPIAIDDAALEQVDFVVLLEIVHGEEFPRQAEADHGALMKHPLVADIVNGKYRWNFAQHWISGIRAAQQNRDQRRLPVVGVKNIRDSQQLGRLQHGPAIEVEALGIVGKIGVTMAIDAVTVEVFRTLDEVKLHAVDFPAIEHRGEAVEVVEGHGNAGDAHGRFPLASAVAYLVIVYAAVIRQI